eukprot:6494811-Prymnesium_polylepis.1
MTLRVIGNGYCNLRNTHCATRCASRCACQDEASAPVRWWGVLWSPAARSQLFAGRKVRCDFRLAR